MSRTKTCDTCGFVGRTCDRCGEWFTAAPLVLPPPFGSVNTAEPVQICGACMYDVLAAVDQVLGTRGALSYAHLANNR